MSFVKAEIPNAIEQSLHGTEQVAKIVRALKEFAHPGPVEMAPTDLNHAIENAFLISRNEWKYVSEVVTEFNPALPLVLCVASALNQVLLNLIVNAAHVIADTDKGRKGEKGTIVATTTMDDDWAQINIRDTGTGIPKAVRSRIFDPFFTTKEVGKAPVKVWRLRTPSLCRSTPAPLISKQNSERERHFAFACHFIGKPLILLGHRKSAPVAARSWA